MEFHYTHKQDPRGFLNWLLELFLCITPSSLINSSHHGFSKLWSVSGATQQYHKILFKFTLPATWYRNCLWEESQSNLGIHLYRCPSFRNHSGVLSVVSCFKYLVQFLVVYKGKAILLCREAKVLSHNILLYVKHYI